MFVLCPMLRFYALYSFCAWQMQYSVLKGKERFGYIMVKVRQLKLPTTNPGQPVEVRLVPDVVPLVSTLKKTRFVHRKA